MVSLNSEFLSAMLDTLDLLVWIVNYRHVGHLYVPTVIKIEPRRKNGSAPPAAKIATTTLTRLEYQ